MNRLCSLSSKILGGFFVAAICALPQAYTISAKPGAVNYIEGTVLIDGQALSASSLKSTFLLAGNLLETRAGKAELLLTPGMFLRIGDNSQVRMLKPSLIGTQIAIEGGESMLEVDEFVKGSNPVVSIRGGLVEIQKTGLYRFAAGGEPSVAVIDGKAEVSFGPKHENVGKGREVLLSDDLKTRKFDKDREDELFAWSNVRAQYNASMSYQAARSVYSSSVGSAGYNGFSGYNGYGYSGYNGFYGNGWLWSGGFNSWLWMPGNSAFFSPFGWGFYGPGLVGYAPVVIVPGGLRGGGTAGLVATGTIPVMHPRPGPGNGIGGVPVPVNANHLPALGFNGGSPASYAAARMQAARAIQATGGLRTASGAQPAAFSRMAIGGGGARPLANGSGGGGHWAGGAGSSGGGHWSGGGGGANSGGGHAMGGGMSSSAGASSHGGGGGGASGGGHGK